MALARPLGLLLVFALSSGCGSYAWRQAKDKDTLVAYRDFLAKHSQDSNADQAEGRIEQLEFAEAQAQHTALAYRRFIEAHPEAAQAETAKMLLESLHFNAAKERGTADAWRGFLAEHPEGAHRAEATAALEALNKKSLEVIPDDPDALAARFEKHPELRTPELEAKLDDRTFARARASGAGKLLEYLDAFPGGTHRDEARTALLSLKVEGLLFSGMLAEAKAELARSPLASQLPELKERLEKAQRFAALDRERDPLAQSARPQKYVRSLPDLIHLAKQPDPLDRWEAVEEMGQHLSVAAIDPLLLAIRQERNPLVREDAFDSLSNVLRGLPEPVAAYELAMRIKTLRTTASSGEVFVALGVLFDLNGMLADAAQSYEKAYDGQDPDPLVLWRWAQIRQERRQMYSAAVAARELAVWAKSTADTYQETPEEGASLASARQVCAAYRNAVFAESLLGRIQSARTDFPEDLRTFQRLAVEAKRLTAARLDDLELQLRTREPGVRLCQDTAVQKRLDAAVKDRRAALERLPQRLPKLAPLLLGWSEQHDPSPELRAQARAELAATTAQRPVP